MFNLHVLFVIIALLWVNCKGKNDTPSKAAIAEMALKKGEVINCSPNEQQYGSVVFENTCSGEVKEDFNLAIKLLHSFEYDEAEKVFSKIIDKQPECAMAYWGVAMANFHPLWTPPTEAELKKGAKAIEIAQQLPQKSKEEAS